jgi:hypothetical protein
MGSGEDRLHSSAVAPTLHELSPARLFAKECIRDAGEDDHQSRRRDIGPNGKKKILATEDIRIVKLLIVEAISDRTLLIV